MTDQPPRKQDPQEIEAQAAKILKEMPADRIERLLRDLGFQARVMGVAH